MRLRLGDGADDVAAGARQDADQGRVEAALGQLGLPEAAPWLRAALQAERLDHEGRPGAGMGVQFPVRAPLLLALGMLQDVDAVHVLVDHLDALAARIRVAGGPQPVGPKLESWGSRTLAVVDPDGYQLSFTEITATGA